MRRLRISPSLLDSYRVLMSGMYNKTAWDLGNDILGVRVPSEAMSRGTAYHRMIEEGPERFEITYMDKTKSYSVFEKEMTKFHTFASDAVAPIFDVRGKYGSMVHEIKAQHTVEIKGYEVVMNMRFDGLDGTTVHEFKTKGRTPAYLDYFDALQWRCYLLAFPELQQVDYTIFELNPNNTKCTAHKFTMKPEADRGALVNSALLGFINWLEMHPHLLAHLEQKAAQPAEYSSLEAW